MKKLIITGLIAVASTAQAAESDRYEILDTLAEEPFFNGTKIDLTLRNYWKYLKENEAQPKEVHNAWGQAFTIDYQSGYFLGFIGFDASFTGVAKLAASDYFASRSLLYNDGPGYDKHNAKGFSKIGQRYAKIKLGNDTVRFNGKAGWQSLKNYGVLTTSNRLSKNSYLGYSGTLAYNNLLLDTAYVTSAIKRDAPNKVKLQTKDKKDIDYIITGGLTYKDKDLYLSYAYGEAQDYQRRHIIEAAYKPVQKFTLASQIYGGYALGNYKTMAANRKEFDNRAWHYAGDAKWQEKDWSFQFGIAYTKAEKENAIGYYNRHMAQNMRGRFNSLSSAGVDYMRDGETALFAFGTYNFIDELTTGVQVNYGQFNYKRNTVRTGEVNLINQWAPRDPRLKNLSVFTMFGYGWSYKNSNRTPTLAYNGKYQRSPNLSGEVIVEYRFNLL